MSDNKSEGLVAKPKSAGELHQWSTMMSVDGEKWDILVHCDCCKGLTEIRYEDLQKKIAEHRQKLKKDINDRCRDFLISLRYADASEFDRVKEDALQLLKLLQ
jgi:hypothetical protein